MAKSGPAVLSATLFTVTAMGADTQPPGGFFSKPSWVGDVGVTVKETYDNNIYMSGVGQAYVPAGTSTLKNEGAWITTVSPKIGVNLAPVLGGTKALQTASFAYQPDVVMYHDHSLESYTAHRFTTGLKGDTAALSYTVDNSFVYVNGSQDGPVYPGGLLNAWATIFTKDRREQFQDRGKITLQHDWDKLFVRPTASLVYFDMRDNLKNPALLTTPSGYQNYEDRNDVNGGADLGYKISPQVAVTVGYRYGHQYQQAFSWDAHESSSDYQRALVGIEAQPWKWLKFQAAGGPDFRSYDANAPVNDHHLITYYGEASVGVTPTANDTVTFKYKQWQFVSSCGRVPYFDSSYDLIYAHKFNAHWSADAEAKVLGADYTSGNLGASSLRNDYDYALVAGIHYTFNKHAGVDLGYCADLGRNAQDNIANSSVRDFQRQAVSLATQLKF